MTLESLFSSRPSRTIAMIFGDAVKDARTLLGVSQGDLAKERGRSQAWLSYIESGQREPTLGDLDYLCARLGLSFPLDGNGEVRNRSWDDATPMEILQARVQHQEEGLNHLKECVCWALEQTAQREGSPVRPEAVLDEEWSK